MNKTEPQIMIIAGEISGDMHAGRLVQAILTRIPNAAVFGIGGEIMRRAGVETLYDVKDMAVMGFSEVLRRYSFFKRVFGEMLALAKKRKPDLVILVDYPGFNLRFAKKAHKLGLKIIYYICPQVWAWNRARIPEMAKNVDRLITIFPFEAEHFEGTGLAVDFVGHPLVDEAHKAMAEPDPELPWQGEPHVALLPGSRETEVERLLPTMLGAACVLEKQYPDAAFIVASPSETIEKAARDLAAVLPRKPRNLSIITGKTRHILRQAGAATVASGTATVEAALLGCPMVIAYKMAPLSFFFCRMLVKVDHIGMVNIIAGRRICPEFVQSRATPNLLARALVPLLEDSPERSNMIEALKQVETSLGTGGVEERAATIITACLE